MNQFMISISVFTAVILTPAMASVKRAKVLVVFSGVDYISLKEGGRHKTGFFLSELSTMVSALDREGYSIVFANPTGKTPVISPDSDLPKWFASEREFLESKRRLLADSGYMTPRKFETFTRSELATFSAVFVPGGYAPMEDLPTDRELGRILDHFHSTGKPTALICHGPIALLANRVFRNNGTWAYSGYRATIVSRKEEAEEEAAGHLGGKQLYYVEDALDSAGIRVSVANAWNSNVVHDRELITGQNPMSARALVGEFMRALGGNTR